MSVHSEQVGQDDVYVVRVNGRLDQTLNSDLDQALSSLLNDGHYTLVVDMSETTYINSGGLRTLVSAWRRVSREGGSLRLCGLSLRLQEIFTMVGFDQVFDIHSDCQETIAQE